MRRIRPLAPALLLVLALPVSAQGALVTVQFRGVVSDLRDPIDALPEIPVGTSISGFLAFDDEIEPSSLLGLPRTIAPDGTPVPAFDVLDYSEAVFFDSFDRMRIEFEVGDYFQFSSSSLPPPDVSRITIVDTTEDDFFLFEYARRISFPIADIVILEARGPGVTSEQFPVPFPVPFGPPTQSPLASATLNYVAASVNRQPAEIDMEITEFSAVPEPSTTALAVVPLLLFSVLARFNRPDEHFG